jgi:hypothetical protein
VGVHRRRAVHHDGAGAWHGSNLGTVVGTATAEEEASVTITYTALPTSKDQCRDGGWKNFCTTFKNQGQCVRFVATGGKHFAKRHGRRH